MDASKWITSGQASLGIELGSTRMKAVLIDPDCKVLASGVYDWENKFQDGYWTYAAPEMISGLQACYADLVRNIQAAYGVPLTKVASLGISGMMHGSLALDQDQNILVTFRTWRNTTAAAAADFHTESFPYNVPRRWGIALLYQAMMEGESHLARLDSLTTLSGYIHYKLTGEKVLGIGDASGMFPIDANTQDFDAAMLDKFADLSKEYPWDIRAVLPKVLVAGQPAGYLTEEGARLLDPSGNLVAGIPLCPPEGDAGTGMVATNSIKVKTGNVSAGTSVFVMLVLEHALSQVYQEIDIVATPSGHAVAMVHCNNCTSDLNAWVQLFGELLESAGQTMDKNALYQLLYTKALEGAADAGGLLSYNYFSGEPLTGLLAGRPLFVREQNCQFNLANFMRAHLLASVASLKVGMDLLLKQEQVTAEKILGHGGFFKTKGVGQRIMAAALNTPVSIMEYASEGGAWGIATLASYLCHQAGRPLEQYLEETAFGDCQEDIYTPTAEELAGFDCFMARYQAGLAVEQAAVECLQ